VPVYFANVLQPLIDFFESILKFFHDSVGFSWGFSIIALTIVVRAALVPLTVKQFKSMQALARLPPESKKLQQRVKKELELYLADNSSASLLHADGHYHRLSPGGQTVRNAQAQLLERICGVGANPVE